MSNAVCRRHRQAHLPIQMFGDMFGVPEDLARHPNRHIAFGGGGVHYCLGTHLARSMLTSLFRELYRQIPGFVAGEPKPMNTNFMRGVLSLPFEPNVAGVGPGLG